MSSDGTTLILRAGSSRRTSSKSVCKKIYLKRESAKLYERFLIRRQEPKPKAPL